MILLITDSDSLSASCIQYSECSLQKEVDLDSILDLDRIEFAQEQSQNVYFTKRCHQYLYSTVLLKWTLH